ncbi:MAG TPA: MASE1 domain-containing protein, partial [Solirubrobacteraceae bacterium]
PLVLAWCRPLDPGLWRRRWLEAALGFAVVAAVSALAVYNDHPLSPLAIPALVWSALRLRQRGATLAVAVLAGFAVQATIHYVGAFEDHSLAWRVLDTQMFLAAASISTLCLAAIVTERETYAADLWASRARLLEGGDRERRLLLNDIHDGVQQSLTALIIHLHLAAETARQEPARAEALFYVAEQETELVINELRELAHGRQPPVLADLGLAAAIRSLANSSPIPVNVHELPEVRLPGSTETTAYFVLAEALTNAHKHANASLIQLRAALSHRILHLEVADNGTGGASESRGSGLQGMRDRVEAIGGTLDIDSSDTYGTRIAADIPIDPFAPYRPA